MKTIAITFGKIASVLCLLSFLVGCKTTLRTIPVEDFFKNPDKTTYKISPSGTYVSYMAPYKDRMNIYVQKAEDLSAQPIQLTNESDRNISGYFWANDNRIMYLKDSGGDENFRLYGVDVDGSNPLVYTPSGCLAMVVDPLENIDTLMLISTNERNLQIFDVYSLNLNTGEKVMVAENPGNIQSWLTDHDGKLRVATAKAPDGISTQILYRASETDPFAVVTTTSFKDIFSYIMFTPDNLNVYAVCNIGQDKTALVEANPATGEIVKTLYVNDKYDIEDVGYSEARKVLTSVFCQGHKDLIRHYFDKEAEETYTKLKAHFPQDIKFSISSYTKDEQRYIVRSYSDKTQGAYYLYDVSTDKMEKITDVAPWLKADDMCEMLPIVYTSRDGMRIEAYLTLPRGVSFEKAKKMPVVINPHGGPWARDSWGYNPEVQMLANRGYAVLQMNFRGSTGYGRKFMEASYKEWGQAMQDDITDGVVWLIEKRIADPKRVAIYGGSYGGYAALSGITFTPEYYACAVDYVGVSNLFTFMATFPPYWIPLREMVYEKVGHPIKDSAMLAACSPALHADKIRVPLFIAQGTNDPRVKKAESDQMVKALKDRGVEVEYMVKDNEGHGFRNQENRYAFYKAMDKFLEKHLLN